MRMRRIRPIRARRPPIWTNQQSPTYLCACAGSGPGECRPLQVHREQQVWRDQRQPLPQHRGGARYQVG